MRTTLITTSLAAFVTLILAGTLSLASAASDADTPQQRSLRQLVRISHYKCAATFETYAPRTFCGEMREYPPHDDGFFSFSEDNIYQYSCTYEAIGDPPNTQFGASTNFLCHGVNTDTALVGQAVGNTMTGQGYGLNVVGGVRSVFTCARVATCP